MRFPVISGFTRNIRFPKELSAVIQYRISVVFSVGVFQFSSLTADLSFATRRCCSHLLLCFSPDLRTRHNQTTKRLVRETLSIVVMYTFLGPFEMYRSYVMSRAIMALGHADFHFTSDVVRSIPFL